MQIAVNHVNQVIRRTRQILMDSSGLSGIMKGVGGCVVGYELTRSTSTIITASYFGGEEYEVLSVLSLARTRVSRRLRGQEKVDL